VDKRLVTATKRKTEFQLVIKLIKIGDKEIDRDFYREKRKGSYENKFSYGYYSAALEFAEKLSQKEFDRLTIIFYKHYLEWKNGYPGVSIDQENYFWYWTVKFAILGASEGVILKIFSELKRYGYSYIKDAEFLVHSLGRKLNESEVVSILESYSRYSSVYPNQKVEAEILKCVEDNLEKGKMNLVIETLKQKTRHLHTHLYANRLQLTVCSS